MIKLYSKFQDSMLKSFEVINTFTSQFSPVLVQWFGSLVQAVTSQAENRRVIIGCLTKCLNLMFLESLKGNRAVCMCASSLRRLSLWEGAGQVV